MNKSMNFSVDLIHEIAKRTINCPICAFNPREWSYYDAEILITAGNMIKRELEELERRTGE